jgi:hypothetical protein
MPVGFGLLVGLGKLATGIVSLLGAKGVVGDVLTGVSAVNTARSLGPQLNYDSRDLSLGEEILGRAKLASGLKGVGSLFTKPGPFDPGIAGGDFPPPPPGGGGTPFDPIPPGTPPPQETTKQAVTTESLTAPPPAPGGISEAEFDPSGGFFGSLSSSSDFDPSGGGLGFFNQGGLVSLLPRRATPAHSPPVWRPRY